MSIIILGIKINQITHTQALQKVEYFLSSPGHHTIFTPNPEMLVKAQKDEYFKKVLNSSDLNLCDGFGLWLAIKLKKKKEKRKNAIERIAGVDFMLDICRVAAEKGGGVYLLGSGDEEVIKKTAEELQKQFPKLKIIGWNKGPTIVETNCHSERSEGSLSAQAGLSQSPNVQRSFASLKMTNDNDDVLREIQNKQPDILFVAFGMGKQEKWICENLVKMPSIKIAMGVGGAFDYISGKVPRAPRLMRKIGLEWVYRLIRQPCRIGRILNATVKFIILNINNDA